MLVPEEPAPPNRPPALCVPLDAGVELPNRLPNGLFSPPDVAVLPKALPNGDAAGAPLEAGAEEFGVEPNCHDGV